MATEINKSSVDTAPEILQNHEKLAGIVTLKCPTVLREKIHKLSKYVKAIF
jgi:hypothetical protein